MTVKSKHYIHGLKKVPLNTLKAWIRQTESPSRRQIYYDIYKGQGGTLLMAKILKNRRQQND